MSTGVLFNPRADRVLYEALCHSYEHADEVFRHEGLPPMQPKQRDHFIDDSIARYVTGSQNAPEGAKIGAFTFTDAQAALRQQARIGAFTRTEDVAQIDRLTFRVFSDMLYSDESWRAAFAPVQVADGERTWEIDNIANPITWQKMAEGGQVRTQRITADRLTFDLDDYATEIGFTRIMMTGRRLYMFISAMEAARASYMAALADAHYSVLQTASTTGAGSTIARGGATTDPTIDRDIATINAGLSKIAADLKDVVGDRSLTMRYILYVPEALEERALAAVRIRLASIVEGRQAGAANSAAQAVLKRTVAVAPTLSDELTANRPILVYPMRKLQSADDGTMMRIYRTLDPKSENQTNNFWATWGIAAADSRQVVELNFG